MSFLLPTFQRPKDRGLAAYNAGNYAEAKPFLLQSTDTIGPVVVASFSMALVTEAKQ